MCFSLMPHVLDELATATSAKKVDEDPQQSRCGVLRRLRVTCGRSDRETGWLQWVTRLATLIERLWNVRLRRDCVAKLPLMRIANHDSLGGDGIGGSGATTWQSLSSVLSLTTSP